MTFAESTNRAPRWGIRIVGVGTVVLILILAILLPGLIALLTLGALIAYLLDPAVQMLERRGLNRTSAASIVFAALSLLVVSVLVVLVPAAVAQFEELLTMDLSRATATFDSANMRINGWIGKLGLEEVDLLDSILAYLGERMPSIIAVLPNALSFIGNLALFPFIVFFLLKDGRMLKKTTFLLIPNRYFEFSLGLLFKMDRQLGNYLRGQLIEAFVVGVLSIAALWILDVPYFLPVGIFTGAANIVPYLGPSTGAVTAVTVILVSGGSPATAFLIVVLFILIQLLDNGVVQPMVISRKIKMHPLLIVVSVVAGGQLFGFFGLLMAVPVIAILKVFFVESVQYSRRYRFQSG
ncbi:MAG: AI-2E family transporter [Bacteroidetes bacterium]|nr:MAG: AI-2E family transporter [Bacteroidota bacterium]